MNIKVKIKDKTNVDFPIIIKDKKGNVIYKQFLDEDGICESTYDENGNELTYKDSEGSYEFTYDKNGNELTFKNSAGYWSEFTYDKKGKEETYKNSDGYYLIKGKKVTKKEFEAFINVPEYTMEELVCKIGNFKLKE
jgi:hypothetical protein